MQVAITGANGFVGRYFTQKFTEQSIGVVALAREASQSNPQLEISDYSDKKELQKAFSECDAVIHLAAKTHDNGNQCWSDFIDVNVQLSERVAQAAIDAGVKRFIFFSSIKALGEVSYPEMPFNHESTPNPQDFYGKSKLLAEELLKRIFSGKNCTLFIVRPPLIWGDNPKGNLAKILSLAKLGIPLPLAKINNRRHWVSLDNLMAFTLRLLTMPLSQAASTFPPLLICDTDAKSTSVAVEELILNQGLRPRLFSLPPILWRALKRLPLFDPLVEKLIGSLVIDASATYNLIDWKPCSQPRNNRISSDHEQ